MKIIKKNDMTKLFFSARKFDSNGFSLVEGITALAVLSFCVAVSLPLFASTFKSSDQNSQEVQAVAKVSTLVEQFRATAPKKT